MSQRKNAISILAIWDDETKVWVAQSSDVPGLCIEAASQQELEARLKVVIPELLTLNNVQSHSVPIELLLRGQSHIEIAC